MSEFGEPWKRIGNEVVSDNGDVVLDVVVRTSRFEQICLDDNEVARIVACVNFLEGVPTETLTEFSKHPKLLSNWRWTLGCVAQAAKAGMLDSLERKDSQ